MKLSSFIVKNPKGGEILFTLNNGETVGSVYGDDKRLLAKLLVEAMETLGHSPSFEEARQYPTMPKDPNLYSIHFGSLEKACLEAARYVNISDNSGDQTLITKHATSARERELKSAEFQMKQIRARVEESNFKKQRYDMEKREEIMGRALALCREHSNEVRWITENSIKKDPILVYREIISLFGSIKQFRNAVKRELYKTKYKESTEENYPSEDTEEIVAAETPTDDTTNEAETPENEEMDDPEPETMEEEESEGLETPSELPDTPKKRTGKRISKTDEELWEELREKTKSLGRLPLSNELNADPNLCSPQTYRSRLGEDWRTVITSELNLKQPTVRKRRTAISKQEPKFITSDDLPELAESAEVTILPIKVVLPKGIKGSIQITLDF